MKKTYQLIKINPNLQVSIPIGYVSKKIPWRNKWLEALRSGHYKQGTGRLLLKRGATCLITEKSYNTDTYCCLGVLSRIQGRLTETGSDRDAGHSCILSPTNPCKASLFSAGRLPNLVKVRYGDFGDLGSLTELNDRGVSFEDIAKLIEILWAQK